MIFILPFCLLCVFVSLCCVNVCLSVCVCYQKMGSWSFARCQLSHTHELPAAAHIWGNQVASLSPYTHRAHLLPLSLTLAASLWLFCTFSLIIGIHCQCFPQTFLIRQCKQNGWVCGLPTHSLSHHLPASFVCPSANSSFSFTHPLSLCWPSFVSCWHFVWHSPG